MTRLAAIVDCSDDAIIGRDEYGTINTWNFAASRLFGYAPDEIIGQSALLLVPPDLHYEELANLERLRQGERIECYETQRLQKGGQRIDVAVTASPIRDSSDQIIGSALVARDSEVHQREQVARLMLAAIVESSDDAIISKNLDGIITSWNAAAERLFGYTSDEMIGQSVLRLIPRDIHFEEPQIIAKLRRGERIEHYETRRMRKNGEIFDVSLTVSPVRDSKGRVVGASKIVRDISERKAAETMLLQKEKLAAAGQMAATLAHEVNNPLEAITNLSYLLCSNTSLDEQARSYANSLQEEAQRAGEITRQTLSYYRDTRSTSAVNVVEILEHLLKWKAKKIAAKHIDLQTQFGTVPPVKGFAGELRQVFENVIENAIDAVGDHARILIRVRTHGEKLVVSICDDGAGIASEVLAKIFDPFFTTKLQTGSGLGLWVSRGVVQKHGGTIRVRSSEAPDKHGTVFSVTLPVSGALNVEQSQKNVA